MRRIRMVIADDHAVLRAGLRMLLNAEPDMEVVGEAGNGIEAVARAGELRPDIVLMDLAMPPLGGIAATEQITSELHGVRVLVLSMHDDESYLHQALRAGASGYVLKKAADSDLLAAIRAVYRGEVYIYPSLAKMLVQDMLRKESSPSDAERHPDDPLSEREREVLVLVAQGYTTQQIADQLVLSPKTVETYRARLTEKLGLRGRAQLVRYAIEKGLLKS